jgi:cell division protein FtsA
MSNIITAIDIGSSKVTAVISVYDGEKIKVIGEATYPSYGIRKGEITSIDEAINSIASALNGAERMAGLTVSSAYVSINGKNIVSNNNKGVVAVSDAEIGEDDVLRALGQARTVAIPPGRDIIHLLPREFIIDQQTGIKVPIGMTGTRLEVDAHIISAPTTAIHNLEKCIQRIGLRIDGIVFTGWASAQSVLTSTEKELGVLLLDFGGGTVSVTTFVEDAVTYSTSIPFGGSNVTRDLAAGLRLSQLEDAEKIKIHAEELFKKADSRSKVDDSSNKTALERKKNSKSENTKNKQNDKKKSDSDILDVTELNIDGVKTISRKLFTEIVEARVTEIFELVKENIEQSGNEYKLPAGIIITGGSANLPNITQLAKDVFGVPARIGIPRGLEGLTDGISGSAYAAVQGLILYGVRDEGLNDASPRKTNVVGLQNGGSLIGKLSEFFRGLMP